jgi:hypothetical protein
MDKAGHKGGWVGSAREHLKGVLRVWHHAQAVNERRGPRMGRYIQNNGPEHDLYQTEIDAYWRKERESQAAGEDGAGPAAASPGQP